jgi:multidrug efflux pump subunit AcrB
MRKVTDEKDAIILLIILIALGGIIMYGRQPIKRDPNVIPSFMKNPQ